MQRLRGKPVYPGSALGTAAVIRSAQGIPFLPAPVIDQMALAGHGARQEPLDLVLVTDDYSLAAGMHLPGHNVVAILCDQYDSAAKQLQVPTVVDLQGITEKAKDYDLVLVDAESGVVLLDPDGVTLSLYQAEQERISPRRRLFLDYTHQAVRTSDGREIRVLGRLQTTADIGRAMESGADGLFVPTASAVLPPHMDDEAQHETLLALGEECSGKAITVAGDAQTVSIPSLLRAATRTEYTLAVPLASGLPAFAGLLDYIAEARGYAIEEQLPIGPVKIAGVLSLTDAAKVDLSEFNLTRLIVVLPAEGLQSCHNLIAALDALVVEAANLMLPLEVVLPSPTESDLHALIGVGVAGVVVDPAHIQSAKSLIRTVSVADCRSELLGAP